MTIALSSSIWVAVEVSRPVLRLWVDVPNYISVIPNLHLILNNYLIWIYFSLSHEPWGTYGRSWILWVGIPEWGPSHPFWRVAWGKATHEISLCNHFARVLSAIKFVLEAILCFDLEWGRRTEVKSLISDKGQ